MRVAAKAFHRHVWASSRHAAASHLGTRVAAPDQNKKVQVVSFNAMRQAGTTEEVAQLLRLTPSHRSPGATDAIFEHGSVSWMTG
jgi:hypothetical protein